MLSNAHSRVRRLFLFVFGFTIAAEVARVQGLVIWTWRRNWYRRFLAPEFLTIAIALIVDVEIEDMSIERACLAYTVDAFDACKY